jgi:nucleoside-diphosphate-sugar epimerase
MRFVNASTCSLYGASAAVIPDETFPISPLSLYGETKAQAEAMVADIGGINLRFATVYGPSPQFRTDLLIHTFIQTAIQRMHLRLFEPHALRPFLHIVDAARAICFALRSENMPPGLYNVGSDESTVSKLELAERVRTLTPVNVVIDLLERDRDGRTYRVNFDRLRRTRFQISKTLDAGLAETLQFMEEKNQLKSADTGNIDVLSTRRASGTFASPACRPH